MTNKLSPVAKAYYDFMGNWRCNCGYLNSKDQSCCQQKECALAGPIANADDKFAEQRWPIIQAYEDENVRQHGIAWGWASLKK